MGNFRTKSWMDAEAVKEFLSCIIPNPIICHKKFLKSWMDAEADKKFAENF